MAFATPTLPIYAHSGKHPIEPGRNPLTQRQPVACRFRQPIEAMSQKIGALFFFCLLLMIAFGLLSFASEFFLGKPLVKLVREYWFLFSRNS